MNQADYRGTGFSIATAETAATPLITVPAGKKAVLHHIYMDTPGSLVEATSGTVLIPTLDANSFVSWSNVGIRQPNAGDSINLTGTDAVAAVYYTLIDA